MSLWARAKRAARAVQPLRQADGPGMVEIVFAPLGDITAHELAVIMQRTQGVESLSRIPCQLDTWVNMDPAIKRHFRVALT